MRPCQLQGQTSTRAPAEWRLKRRGEPLIHRNVGTTHLGGRQKALRIEDVWFRYAFRVMPRKICVQYEGGSWWELAPMDSDRPL
eukprot:scaffold89935_cov29-Tisochrysis_lutea.AAC.2